MVKTPHYISTTSSKAEVAPSKCTTLQEDMYSHLMECDTCVTALEKY